MTAGKEHTESVLVRMTNSKISQLYKKRDLVFSRDHISIQLMQSLSDPETYT